MNRAHALIGITLLMLAGCHGAPSPAAATTPPAKPHAAHAGTSTAAGMHAAPTPEFVPPPESAIPEGPFGDMVRQGRELFVHTDVAARPYVGNGLTCANCHLDAGRRANASPMWGAWGMYPQYRRKTGSVNTFGQRIQGCFEYSMNGTAPPLDSTVVRALEAYSYWMAKDAPSGVRLAGAGYPRAGFTPPQPPDYHRGQQVYQRKCALCHGPDGAGQEVAGRYVFPPLWGPDSFNWGAGMHELDKAAAFIKANMPLSRGGSLSDQEAWDAAMFMDAHERPQDPRYRGNLMQTRQQFHNSPMSLYGTVVNGHRLGSAPSKP